MSTNPAAVSTIPKVIHLGVDTEFHVAPGERVLFAGPGQFALVFPGDSPFNEHVFSYAHATSLPAREGQGQFQYYWAQAGVVGSVLMPAGAVPASIVTSGVVAPVVKPVAAGPATRGGCGTIVVS